MPRARLRFITPALIAVIIGYIAFRSVPKPLPELSREELLTEVRSGHVREVHIKDHDTISAFSSTRGAFRTVLKPDDKDLVDQLRSQGVDIVFERDSGVGF